MSVTHEFFNPYYVICNDKFNTRINIWDICRMSISRIPALPQIIIRTKYELVVLDYDSLATLETDLRALDHAIFNYQEVLNGKRG